jgi:hypothetical protein
LLNNDSEGTLVAGIEKIILAKDLENSFHIICSLLSVEKSEHVCL